MVVTIIGCSSDVEQDKNVELQQLENYETVVAYEDNILGSPAILKYSDSHLFLYDSQQKRVLKVDDRGEIVNDYGRDGRGPGEFFGVSDIFLVDGNVRILDTNPFWFHEYDQDGNFIRSLTFDPTASRLRPPPPLPPIPQNLSNFLQSAYQYNFDNQAHVTDGGDILLPGAYEPDATALYKLNNEKGEVIAFMGELPIDSRLDLDFEAYKSSIANREVPSVYKPNTFLVKDKANPEEYFLVYSGISKIEKYNLMGEILWETAIPKSPETESMKDLFYETADHLLDILDIVVPFRQYRAGVSNLNGELFLATYKYVDYEKTLRIHRFTTTGELSERYEPATDGELLPVFDVDASSEKMLIATDEGEIRAYSFD